MKDHLPLPSPPPPPATNLPKIRRALAKATTFITIFSLGYTLGVLSASSSSGAAPSSPFSPPSLPQFRQQSISQPQPTPTPTPTLPPPPPPGAAAEAEKHSSPPLHDLFRFRTRCAPPVPQSEILPTVLSRVFNGTSPYAGFPPPETAALLRPAARRLRGWGSTMPVFAELIAAVRPSTIIELGTFLGASALHMAAVSRNLSLDPIILCLDDFRGWPEARLRFGRDLPEPRHGEALLLPQFMLAVAAAGEEGRVVPFPFSTGSGLAALCEWGVYGDLIEVDAGHDFHSAWADINMAYAVLRPGGVLFGHDYFTGADDHGVRRAVRLFAKTKGIRVRPHGQHWVLDPKPSSHR